MSSSSQGWFGQAMLPTEVIRAGSSSGRFCLRQRTSIEPNGCSGISRASRPWARDQEKILAEIASNGSPLTRKSGWNAKLSTLASGGGTSGTPAIQDDSWKNRPSRPRLNTTPSAPPTETSESTGPKLAEPRNWPPTYSVAKPSVAMLRPRSSAKPPAKAGIPKFGSSSSSFSTPPPVAHSGGPPSRP